MKDNKKYFCIYTEDEIYKRLIKLMTRFILEKEKENENEITKKIEKPKSIKKNLSFYINKLASRFDTPTPNILNWLTTIYKVSKISFLNIILREIAIDLDEKYDGHIENSKDIYVISSFNGKVYKINKKVVRNYRNFSAFRTLEDANFAIEIVKLFLKEMFKYDNGKQKNKKCQSN